MTDRHGIGGNAPPYDGPDQELHLVRPSVDDVLEEARAALTGVEVQTEEQAESVKAVLATIKAKKKDVKTAFDLDKQPIREAGGVVDTANRELVGRLDTGIKTAQDALTPYLNRLQAEREEKAREAAQEAAEAQRKLEEAHQAKQGPDLEEAENIDALEKQAKDAKISAAKAKKPTATGLKKTTTVTLDSALAACGFYLEDPRLRDALQAMAQQDVRSGKTEIPGFTITKGSTAR